MWYISWRMETISAVESHFQCIIREKNQIVVTKHVNRGYRVLLKKCDSMIHDCSNKNSNIIKFVTDGKSLKSRRDSLIPAVTRFITMALVTVLCKKIECHPQNESSTFLSSSKPNPLTLVLRVGTRIILKTKFYNAF